MNRKCVFLLAMILYSSFVFLPLTLCQQGSTQPGGATPNKVVTPEQKVRLQRAKESKATRQGLQAQAKQIFDAEMAREKAGDCNDAQTTYDFNVCFGKQGTTTDENLSSFERIVRELIAPEPQLPAEPATGTSQPVTAIAGPIFTPQQLAAEFDHVEQSWRQYRDTACAAAFHQFSGGSGGPSFELQCELKLARDHMRELDVIYGSDLHL
ncbi:MAG: lysozyme inhibitor LprI family protein [Terracidiphilus sp.]|jgi:uncharacterized protein YecT (DUF1311 family)